MQNLHTTPVPQETVRVRRQRWSVVRTKEENGVAVVTVAGVDRANGGTVTCFLAPFDTFERESVDLQPRRASRARWHRVLRSLLLRSAPPGGLSTAATARIDLLPHQLAPAMAFVRGSCTRALLADDVGLGKTIEAGLILAELRERGAVSRALLLTPAGLRDQWCDELRDRFGVIAFSADMPSLRIAADGYAGPIDPWQTADVVVASIDLVKRPEHLASVVRCAWDLVIVDEAHHAATESARRAAVDALASRTPYVVLVTATPHNGDRESFDALCSLGGHGDRVTLFRRTRAEVTTAARRRARVLRVGPTAAERRMHDALAVLTKAVVREHAETDRDTWLGLSVLNKRALSSARALQRSVGRRLQALDAEHDGGPVQAPLPLDDPTGELDAGDEADAWRGGPALANVARERRLLTAIERAAAEAAVEGESKVRAIARWVRRIREPAIVFTEYRDTLREVSARLGPPVLELHGGLTAAERRAAIDAFNRATEPVVLVATDTAGEGLNLHHRCRVVISLELPWNPVRLEQRIGRVDRLGQRRTVHALAFVGADTPEERILQRMRRRVARAVRDVGSIGGLGFTEREIERLVLTNVDSDPVGCPAEPPFATIDLGAAPEIECERASLVRVVRRAMPNEIVESGPLAGTARRWDALSRLGGGAIVIVEITAEDGTGAPHTRTLLPLHVDHHTSPGLLEALLADVSRVAPIAQARVEAHNAMRRFTEARLVRQRSIGASCRLDVRPAALQRGLFDARAERAVAEAAAATSEAIDVLQRQLAFAERAASGCRCRATVRLVIEGRR